MFLHCYKISFENSPLDPAKWQIDLGLILCWYQAIIWDINMSMPLNMPYMLKANNIHGYFVINHSGSVPRHSHYQGTQFHPFHFYFNNGYSHQGLQKFSHFKSDKLVRNVLYTKLYNKDVLCNIKKPVLWIENGYIPETWPRINLSPSRQDEMRPVIHSYRCYWT